MADWTTLDELPAGTLFETEGGTVALKTEYNRIVGSGEVAWFDWRRPNEIRVRPLNAILSQAIAPSTVMAGKPSHTDYPTDLRLLNRHCTLAVTSGSSRFGTVVSQDDRGIWFCGTMERDNPKEKQRTYFVPWTSVVWLEMEES